MRLRPSFLRRFFGDGDGVAAVEFAFIAPVLIVAYFGIAELCGAMLAERKAYHAASAIGDLVTQDSAPATSDINDIFTVANTIMLPYSSTSLQEYVTSIQEQSNGTYQETWTCSSTSSTCQTMNSSYSDPKLANLIQPGQSVILAEVKYTYKSPIQYILPNALNYDEKFYLRPRLVDPIPPPT